MAAFDASTANATQWNPTVDGGVYALAAAGDAIYIGGSIGSVDGQTRNYAAAVDATTGQPLAWNPNANSVVSAVTIANNVVYVGGSFGTINGQPHRHFAVLDSNGNLQ